MPNILKNIIIESKLPFFVRKIRSLVPTLNVGTRELYFAQ